MNSDKKQLEKELHRERIKLMGYENGTNKTMVFLIIFAMIGFSAIFGILYP